MSPAGTASIKAPNGPLDYCLNILSSVSLSDREKLSLVIGDSLITFKKHTVFFLSPWISEIIKDEYSCLKNHVFISLTEEASLGGFQSLKAIIETGVAPNLSNYDKEELIAAINLLGMNIHFNEVMQQNNDHGVNAEGHEELQEPENEESFVKTETVEIDENFIHSDYCQVQNETENNSFNQSTDQHAQEDVLSDIEDDQNNGETSDIQFGNNESILIEDLYDESDIVFQVQSIQENAIGTLSSNEIFSEKLKSKRNAKKCVVKLSFVAEPKLSIKDYIRKPEDTTPNTDYQEPEDDLSNKSDGEEIKECLISPKECPICERRPCLSYSVYGAFACNNCRLFFLRTVRRERKQLRLERCQQSASNNNCDLKRDRVCMPCRYEKCLALGMEEDFVRTDEEIKKKYFFKGATEKVTEGPKEARSWNRPEKYPGKEVKQKKISEQKKKVRVVLAKKKNQHLRKNAQNTTKENLKERNIAKAKLANKSSNSNKKSVRFSSRRLDISANKTNATKRKKPGENLNLSRKLNLNSSNTETCGHSDDMFEHCKAPSRVSQKALEDSSSDDESDPDDISKTPVVNYVKGFEGWSQKTPDKLHMNEEEEEKSKTPGQSKRCLFSKSDISQKKSKAAKGKKDKVLKKATVAKSKPGNLNSYLSKLKPALSETEEQPNSEMEEDKEQYFEDM